MAQVLEQLDAKQRAQRQNRIEREFNTVLASIEPCDDLYEEDFNQAPSDDDEDLFDFLSKNNI